MLLRSALSLFVLVLLPSAAKADLIGIDYPGTSAKDILLQGGSLGSGTYFIDPDITGPITPFAVFADMVTSGGGWTLADDAQNIRPDLTGRLAALNILANAQQAQIRIQSPSMHVMYTGTYNGAIPIPTTWSILSGTSFPLYPYIGRTLAELTQDYPNTYDIWIRELNTVPYPAPLAVPEPSSLAFVGLGLLGLTFSKRFRKLRFRVTAAGIQGAR